MEDSGVPIGDNVLINQLVTHMARSGVVSKARQKWERHLESHPNNNNWNFGKKWFPRELQDVTEAEEDTGMEKGEAFQVKQEQTTQDVRDEMSQKMHASLTSIAMAATAKQEMISQSQDTIGSLTANNTSLTSKIDQLLSKNRRLAGEVARLSNMPPTTVTPYTTTTTASTITASTGAKTEENSQGLPCAVQPGTGRLAKYTHITTHTHAIQGMFDWGFFWGCSFGT